ncbi:apolipoprotein D-like [Pollicipes pollicipes]|uniref:apolipoprotein D-like n=1 Tax=Pollicipes pollicipes TaxID=41117 RepID=UPI001884963D|nr:apolipoprotein D-like [Pollicipes pollicipes]XP_037086197.1 apolipoprotein D-like [Pollicipes pollicipes]
MTMMKSLLLFASVVAVSLAKCPDLKSLDEFDATQYTGQWYEISRYPLIGELGETCVQTNYTLKEDGTIRLENRGKKPDGSIDSIMATATVKDPAHPASLSVVFDEGFRGSYNVIRTDYTQSALVYACDSLLGFNVEYAWILSRTAELDQSTQDEYVKLMADAGSATNKLTVTPQDCGSVF